MESTQKVLRIKSGKGVRVASKILHVPIRKETERWLVLPDIHVPEHDKKAYGAVLKYASDNKYDGFIQLGDWVDFNTISSHNKGILGKIEGNRVQKDFEALEKSIEEVRQAVGPKVQKYLTAGNHEYRLTRFLDEHPELKGLPDFDLPGRIKRVAPEMTWVPFWEEGKVLQVGKAKFIHGRNTGRYPAAKVARDYQGNVFFGHVHSVEYLSETTVDDHETRGAMALGCLQSPKASWMHGRPNRWQHAFAEFFFFKNGNFTFYVPQIFSGQFIAPTGKVYKG